MRPDPDVDLADLDRDTLRELRSLGLTGNRVGKHLLTAAAVVDTDPEEALRQLRAAVRRGARLPVVRETAGVVAYAAGDFALALRELRTATRLGVGSHLLPLMVDCERALGRPDRALELATGADGLDADTGAELAIVVSGIHRDAGDPVAALAALADPPAGVTGDTVLRWRYARAEALVSAGDSDSGQALFEQLARDDNGGITDAAERLAAVHGLLFDDLAEDVDDPEQDDSDSVADLGDPVGDDGNPVGDDGNPVGDDGDRSAEIGGLPAPDGDRVADLGNPVGAVGDPAAEDAEPARASDLAGASDLAEDSSGEPPTGEPGGGTDAAAAGAAPDRAREQPGPAGSDDDQD